MTVTRSGKLICVVLLILICFSVKTSHSETRYVSDVLVITLREGPGAEYEIIRVLTTNTPFEVLEEGDGYLKIRTTKGEEGWVSTRYTTTNTPKPIIISGLEKKIGRLQTEIEKFEQKNASLSDKITVFQEDFALNEKTVQTTEGKMADTISSTQKELAEINRKYTTLYKNSKNVVALADAKKEAVANNVMLKEENKELKARVAELEKEKTNLLFIGLLKWFLVGAGVLLTGMILGRMSKKKKSYY